MSEANSKPFKKSSADSTANPKEAADPNKALYESLEEHDLLLVVDITVYDKQGKVFKIKGNNTLPQITEDNMLPESYRNFEQLFHSSIARPLLSSFRKYISKFIKRKNEPEFVSLASGNSPNDQRYLSES